MLNCDHKLITKAISAKLTKALENTISPSQTAYIKNRTISDNLRVMLSANNIKEIEPNFSGLMIALDAKKAFDSVSHNFIKKTLVKIGLQDLITTFELLYKEQKVDIDIYGISKNGYMIGNGVKQGDSLSCILFILTMEPLIRNIEANALIEKLPKH